MRSDYFQKIGIFSFSLLATVFAVYLYSPVISSHAETSSKSLEVNAEIKSIISIKSITSEVNVDARPGEVSGGVATVVIATNSQYGYSLMMEDVDTSSDLVNRSNPEYKLTSDFTGSKSFDDMDVNTWGYAMNLEEEVVHSIPVYGNPVRIKTTDNVVDGTDSTYVGFGAKFGRSLPSGQYIDYVLFTAITNGQDGSPYSIPAAATTMQDFGCPWVPGQRYDLIDTRNNKQYEVRSTSTGECWMMENLDLSGLTITSEDSELYYEDDDPISFTIPSSMTTWSFSYSEPEVYQTNIPGYGTYYNYAAASANYNATSWHNYGNICPTGWDIPGYDEWIEAGANQLNLVKSGMYSVDNGVTGQGETGMWWTYNKVDSSEDTDGLGELSAVVYNEDGLVKTDVDGKNGLSIRCMSTYYGRKM